MHFFPKTIAICRHSQMIPRAEVNWQRVGAITKLTISMEETSGRVVGMAIFCVIYYQNYDQPGASTIFMTLCLLENLRLPCFFFLHYGIETTSQLAASLRRVQVCPSSI